MADKCRFLDIVLSNEVFNVYGHARVVVDWGVGTVAVVAEVECVDRPGEVFG